MAELPVLDIYPLELLVKRWLKIWPDIDNGFIEGLILNGEIASSREWDPDSGPGCYCTYISGEEVLRYEAEHAPSNKKMTNTAPEKENTRVIDTLHKILVAVAIDCYGYDSEAKKNTTVKDIETALDKVGLSISKNTIRTHLEAGTEFLPRD